MDFEVTPSEAALLDQPRTFRGNQTHLRLLIEALQARTPAVWRQWRKRNPDVRPDLRGVDLSRNRRQMLQLGEIDLSGARLANARLSFLHSWGLQLRDADLRHADLCGADLSRSDLRHANFESARLVCTNLTLVSAQQAVFRHANLSHAIMNAAHLEGADFHGAKVTGLSTWDVHLDSQTRQGGLVLEELGDYLEDLVDDTDAGVKPRVVGHLDRIEAAYLLNLTRDRTKLKTVIDAMTRNLVLLLGNFGRRRKTILTSISNKLVTLGYMPVIFDFKPPDDRDLIEAVAVLAGLSCFVIADLTQPKSTPLEAMLIVPHLGVPFATIIQRGHDPFSMFGPLHKYGWALPTWTYRDKDHLVRRLKTAVVDPCERIRRDLRRRRRRFGARATGSR
jgi:uncharacterized protein YjbI with pentapeptide repeats